MSIRETIRPIDITHTSTFALEGTCGRLVPLFAAISIETLQPSIQAFTQKAAAYSKALERETISVRTEEIQRLDRERDLALTELFRNIANERHSGDPAITAAAHACDIVLRTFGNPARRPMTTQTNILRDITDELTTPAMLPNLQRLPIAHAITLKLQSLNARFGELFNARTFEYGDREPGIVRRTRKDVEAALRLVIGKINAYILLYGNATLADTVASADSILEEARHLINRRAGQRHRHADEGGATAESGDAAEGT